MANIDNVQLPDGSSYNIIDNTSGFATQNYVDSAVSSVTKTTIGLGNVDNTSDLNKPISTATQTALDAKASDTPTFTEAPTRANIESGESLSTLFGKIRKWFTDLPSMFVAKSGDTMSGNLGINRPNGTASTVGISYLTLGNDIVSGTVGNSQGAIQIYGKGNRYGTIFATNMSSNRVYELPNASGTLALTSQLGEAFYQTQVNISCNTAVSGMTPFSYKGESLAVSENNIKIIAAIPVTPSSGEWIFSISSNETTKKIKLFSNGSATIAVKVLYMNV